MGYYIFTLNTSTSVLFQINLQGSQGMESAKKKSSFRRLQTACNKHEGIPWQWDSKNPQGREGYEILKKSAWNLGLKARETDV